MDEFLIIVVGVAVFAIIWLWYGLVNQKARFEGIAAVGYGAVAASIVMSIIFLGVAIYR